MRREWIEIRCRRRRCRCASGLPPCGGSGLKCGKEEIMNISDVSPSMRREWIEILKFLNQPNITNVSLHAEGVD